MTKNPFLLLLGVFRLVLLFLHVLAGLFLVYLFKAMPGKRWFDSRAGKLTIRVWSYVAAMIIGVRLKTTGQPIHGLWVVNHISWLDIIAISSIDPARFVSKAEVKQWPVLGILAEKSGTFFLQRNSPRAAKKCLEDVTCQLHKGRSIIVFPEGTTSDGSQVLHFHGTFFQAAIDGQARIQPIALEYRRASRRDWLAPYIDDDTFIPHLFRLVCTPYTEVAISFLDPVQVRDRDRKSLASICQQRISSLLVNPVVVGADQAEESLPINPLGQLD